MEWGLTILVGAAIVTSVLAWVHWSQQTRVPRSFRNNFIIAMRIIALFSGGMWLLCGLLSVPLYFSLAAMLFVLLMSSHISFDSFPAAEGPIEFAFGMALIIPFYVLQQFVLGFPDRDRVVLVPPEVPVNRDPPPRQSDTGVVVSTLRPMGQVVLAGDRFTAASEDGRMLAVGTLIRVCGQRGTMLLVSKVEETKIMS